ncbi:ATP-binding protein [Vibrio sp. Isolate23]|uniref:ATP-binding protein n=1 Tax=Vibrio sp. Isolate23 TaxID=2908533 RepID=UPI001EFD84A5|nr:ATP-binding protein [Vibrio sp. Isolate23]MCG9681255.1 ATP-binding protein [Vibrio sp. Isolate23]
MTASSIVEDIIETYEIRSESDVMSSVIATYTLAAQFGFSTPAVSELSTVVSELGMNIVKYAESGVISVWKLEREEGRGMKVVAQDHGPGIEDVDKALEENYSTGRSLGLGLSGVQRMVDEFEIDTCIGQGTRIQVVKWRE